MSSRPFKTAKKLHRLKTPGESNRVFLRKLLNRYYIDLFVWSFPQEMSGVLILDRRMPNPVIGLNRFHSDERKLFTAAHELGHFFLRHGEAFCSNLQDQNQYEREANMFAAELLMPREQIINKADQPIDKLARKYEVSQSAMHYRLLSLRPDSNRRRGSGR